MLVGCASATPATGDFARRNRDVPTATIWGDLTLPRNASGRVPAVVLVHGSSGVGSNMPGWRSELTGMGVAVFIMDSFTGRAPCDASGDRDVQASRAVIVRDLSRG